MRRFFSLRRSSVSLVRLPLLMLLLLDEPFSELQKVHEVDNVCAFEEYLRERATQRKLIG